MTLILTAVCRDGIVVCADKRGILKTTNGVSCRNDLNKIYEFSQKRVIAFNHGINRLCGKDWRSILSCFELAAVRDWQDFSELVDTFKSFVSPQVDSELLTNRFDDALGFVFCGIDGQPIVRELFWKKESQPEDRLHTGLVRSGSGAAYLERHLAAHPEVNTVEYWHAQSVVDGKSDVRELFIEASKEQAKSFGNEFSNDFDIAVLHLLTNEALDPKSPK